MKTTEKINFFADNEFTDDQGYNLLIEDLWNIRIVTKQAFEDQPQEAHIVTVADMTQPVAQALVQFFMYQIQEVLFPAIRVGRLDAANSPLWLMARRTGDPGHAGKDVLAIARETLGLDSLGGLGSSDVDNAENSAKTPQEKGSALILRMFYEGFQVNNPLFREAGLKILAGETK